MRKLFREAAKKGLTHFTLFKTSTQGWMCSTQSKNSKGYRVRFAKKIDDAIVAGFKEPSKKKRVRLNG